MYRDETSFFPPGAGREKKDEKERKGFVFVVFVFRMTCYNNTKQHKNKKKKRSAAQCEWLVVLAAVSLGFLFLLDAFFFVFGGYGGGFFLLYSLVVIVVVVVLDFSCHLHIPSLGCVVRVVVYYTDFSSPLGRSSFRQGGDACIARTVMVGVCRGGRGTNCSFSSFLSVLCFNCKRLYSMYKLGR